MSDNKTSIIDHAQIAAAVKDIRAHAGDFDVTAECAAVLDAFDREVREGTDVSDFGIWEEPRAYLIRWLSIIQEKVAEVARGMEDDADWLEEVSRKAREVQDNAANQAQNLGQNLGGGIGTNSSTFDPRTFRDVTPSIAVPVTPTAPENPTPNEDAPDPAQVQQRIGSDPSAAAQVVAQNASDISTVMQRVQGDGVLADLIQRAEGAGFHSGDKSNAELWSARADWLKSHPDVLAAAFQAHPAEWGAAIAANPSLTRSVTQ